jgi:hypothetical protein
MKYLVQLIYFNAGGGHRSAALALQEVIAQKHPDWSVTLVNLFEVIDSDRYYQKLTGFAPEDLYNLRLKKGWTRGLATELKIFQTMIRLTLPKLKKKVRSFWGSNPPNLVVSLVPNFNKVMYEALRDELPGVPYVTVLTDMADYPPHFWMEPRQGQYIICGTAFAASQAAALGYDHRAIVKTSGMILRPDSLLERGSVRVSLDGSVVEDLMQRRVDGLKKSLNQPAAPGWQAGGSRLSDRLNESQRGSQHIEDVTAVETTGNDDVIND